MADIKISEMDPADALDGTELIPMLQDGANVAGTAEQLRDYVTGEDLTVVTEGSAFTAEPGTHRGSREEPRDHTGTVWPMTLPAPGRVAA